MFSSETIVRFWLYGAKEFPPSAQGHQSATSKPLKNQHALKNHLPYASYGILKPHYYLIFLFDKQRDSWFI
jgi:hypothetical protein